MSEVFYIKQDDTGPSLLATLLAANGAVVNLTGASVVFHMRDADNNMVITDGTVTVVDETAGEIRYDWQATNTANVGIFYGEFEVTYADTSIETFPNNGYLTVQIIDDIA